MKKHFKKMLSEDEDKKLREVIKELLDNNKGEK